MQLIYKYTHKGPLRSTIDKFKIPKKSRFLYVGNQYEKLTFWFEVDEYEKELIDYNYVIVETGSSVAYNLKHLGTVLFYKGSYVCHIFKDSDEWEV